MKDPDSSRDVKKPDAEDMSLADLLGADAAEEPSAARRVDARADEPDSGMVNLARMVAGSSVETATTPSIAPPPAPGPEGRDPTGGHAMIAPPGAAAAPSAQKSNPAIWALVAAVIVLGAVGIYYFTQSKDESKDDAATQALLDLREAIEKERREAEEQRRAAEEKLSALMAKLEDSKSEEGVVDEAAQAALEKEIADAKAAQEEAAKKAAAAKAESEKAGGGTKVAAAAPKKTASEPAAAAPKKPAAEPKAKPAETKPAAGGTSELDSLLGAPKKTDTEKKATAPADTTPTQMSKSDIQQAMNPVAARAQTMCAKYSTGSVQVRVTVANTGRVQSSEAVGAFANSTAGNCVAALVRTAKFPKFKDATQTFTYPIVLK